MAFTVFISHSVKDFNLVQQLAYWLEQSGIRAYVAEQYPEPGTRLPDKIARAIESHDCLIALMTVDGANSQWVHQEVGYAKKAGILIVPVVEEGVIAGGFLEGVEYIPFRRYDPYDAITRVVEYLSAVSARKEQEERNKAVLAGLMIFFGLLALDASAKKRRASESM